MINQLFNQKWSFSADPKYTYLLFMSIKSLQIRNTAAHRYFRKKMVIGSSRFFVGKAESVGLQRNTWNCINTQCFTLENLSRLKSVYVLLLWWHHYATAGLFNLV